MKDFLGNEVNVGDYFAYPTIVGRSASMNVYEYVETTDNGYVKARPIERAYGKNVFKDGLPYCCFDWNEANRTFVKSKDWEKKLAKFKDKCSTLQMFSERALLLKDFQR